MSEAGPLRLPRAEQPEVVSPEPSTPMSVVLSGERARRKRVSEQLDHLRSLDNLRSQPGNTRSWQDLLAGEVPEVSGGGVHPHSKKCIQAAGASIDRSVMSFGGAINSGADYGALGKTRPTNRYKFYHSFGDQTGSEAYLTEVIRQANDAGLSLNMKTFDHAYDGINLYTHHFNELREIILNTYNAHEGAFMSTEHFLQGTILGIDSKHIGWVQEPIAGLGHLSHSGRMGQIGHAFDQRGFSEKTYIAGCESAGVLADQPWLLRPDYEQSLIAKANTLHS